MDYKEKYEQALERAKEWSEGRYGHSVDDTPKDIAEYIFPELKESEDERIRKALIHYFDISYNIAFVGDKDIKNKDIIAWLEKQGTPAKLSEEEQNKFAKGVLTSCALSFIDYLDAHKHEGKMCVSNGECEDIENAFHNAMWDRLHRYYSKYIEKQGEQETLCDKCRKKHPSHSCQDIAALGRCAVEHEQKSTDNGESSFLTVERAKEVSPFTRSDSENESVGWSEEDEDAISMATIALENMYDPDEPNNTYAGFTIPFNKAALRLRYLKERGLPKIEWSKEDERQWNNIWDVLDGRFELSEEGYKNAANWFKSIKDRYQVMNN